MWQQWWQSFVAKLDVLVVLGLAGQALFSARFVVQWIVSERRRQSVIPRSFWYLSVGGSTILLLYSILRHDPVFIVAFLFNNVIYVRNLMLIAREKRLAPANASGVSGDP